MALSFHTEGKKPSIYVTLCKSKNGLYLDFDGYYVYIPQCSDYASVVELLIIFQESFEKGFTLLDASKE